MTTDRRASVTHGQSGALRLCRRCGEERALLEFVLKGGRIVKVCERCRDEQSDERNMLRGWRRR